jgi:putative ABC transport system ATP-binding protein
VTNGAEVVLDGVTKSFDGGRIRALDGVTLRIAPGELVSLTGPSGSGKSTLLNLVGALDRPDGGTITVGGRRVDALGDATAYRAETVGFVFQLHNLIPALTASENVQVPMLGRIAGRKARARRADELLDDVGLSHRSRSRPPTLSGGERQRVAIARALANEPPLVLGDEPTGALDSATSAQVVALLREIRERRGTTILLVTNDDEVAAAADRGLRLRDGRVTPVGAPRPASA